jgi:RNA polymerase sigma factor (sigma-70 family)
MRRRDPDGVNHRREYPSDLGLQVWASVPGQFPRARTTIDSQPENEYQALMESTVASDPVVSKEEEEELREAVAAIVDLLPPKERRVIEAAFYEQEVTVREIERQIHVPKSSVSRLRERALQTLADLMSTNETIQRRIMQDKPSNWEEAARSALMHLHTSAYYVEDYSNEVTDAIDAAYVHWSDMSASKMWIEFANAGRIAWEWLKLHYEQNEARLFEEVIELLMERQAKYGHANIMKFQDLGLCVRMSDKAARLGNLEEGGKTFDDETVIDTWMDILGYSTIAEMLRRDWFLLELP